MTKNRLIFYAIFAAFNFAAFIFTLILENNTQMLFSMVQYVPWFKYGTLLGLILVIIDVIWSWFINRESQKEKAALTHELNTLKAKLFDLQEEAKSLSNISKSSATTPTQKNP
jgi:ABC-type transport system involved in cytochrome bd biosynthesis fused ATPase/permease subunit